MGRSSKPRMTEVISEESACKMIIMLQGGNERRYGRTAAVWGYHVNADMEARREPPQPEPGRLVRMLHSHRFPPVVGGRRRPRDPFQQDMTYGQGVSSFGFARLRLFLPKGI